MPPKKFFLIYDNYSSQYFLKYLDKNKVFILHTRGETLCIPILLKTIVSVISPPIEFLAVNLISDGNNILLYSFIFKNWIDETRTSSVLKDFTSTILFCLIDNSNLWIFFWSSSGGVQYEMMIFLSEKNCVLSNIYPFSDNPKSSRGNALSVWKKGTIGYESLIMDIALFSSG